MNRLWAALVFVLTFSVSCPAKAQGPQATLSDSPSGTATSTSFPEATGPGYSQEPFVIERYYTIVRFENDGTSERDLSVRIRVQSDAGALQLASLAFPYNTDSEQINVRFVRVLESDGSTVNANPDAIKDASAPEVLDAPAYANAMEKRIAVPELHPGDILEYEVSTRLVHPFAPGEFWLQHSFLDDAIVLDERFEVDAPLNRKITIKSPNFSYSTNSDPAKGRIMYLWKRANLTSSASHDSSKRESEPETGNRPDVQLTTFESWEEVSRWYAKLQGRIEPPPEIRAKTMDLIKGRASELDKIQALYQYVSQNIRYISLPLGAAGYRSHSAGEVFANGYGDCRDQQTLLAAMLQAAGIQAYAALIPYSEKLDVSLPSPAQFDHVITAVPQGNEFIWMDSTAVVAPFRFLPSPLRKKSALMVAPDGAGKIADTPANPPFLSAQQVEIDATMSDLGKVTAKVRYQMRGDTEFLLRLAFLRSPQSQWKGIGQTILAFDGVHGNIISVKSSDPRDTRNPFEIEMEYTQWDFLDWPGHKNTLPMPLLVIGMPDLPDNGKPVYLGSPLNVVTRATLMLPPGFTAAPPAETAMDRDYAAFKSSYRFEGHTLTAERSLAFKAAYLPASRRSDYLAFRHAVEEDQNRMLVIENSGAGTSAIPSTASAGEIFEAGTAALASGNMHAAVPLFKRLVELEPGHEDAWNDLGLAYLRLGQFSAAEASFQKQIEVNPGDRHARDYLGLALQQQHRYDEAAVAFQRQIEMNPLDGIAHAALGEIFLGEQEYPQATPELEKATILLPENAELQVSLGQACIYTGETAKALAAFEKAAELSPTPAIWNNVALNMADHRIDLEKAQGYAQSAVLAAVASLQSADLTNIANVQWNTVTNIANYWDTLGWVYFQKGDLAAAKRYIHAAWLLDQNGEIGDHLAQVYQQQGQKDQAIQMYALALAAPHSVPDTRARLTLLLGGNAAIDDLVAKAKPLLEAARVFSAGKILRENVQASFLILLSPGKERPDMPIVDSVRFNGGSESLKPFADRLRTLDYGPIFPDTSAARIPRRGTLSCSASSDECRFILLPPEEASGTN